MVVNACMGSVIFVLQGQKPISCAFSHYIMYIDAGYIIYTIYHFMYMLKTNKKREKRTAITTIVQYGFDDIKSGPSMRKGRFHSRFAITTQ